MDGNLKFSLGSIFSDIYNYKVNRNCSDEIKTINSVFNLYVPIKIYTESYPNAQDFVRKNILFFNEPICDIGLDSFLTSDLRLVNYKYQKYHYLGLGLSFYGYTYDTLIDIVETILFKYCDLPFTKTVPFRIHENKYQKRANTLSLLHLYRYLYNCMSVNYSRTTIINNLTILKNTLSEMINKIINIIHEEVTDTKVYTILSSDFSIPYRPASLTSSPVPFLIQYFNYHIMSQYFTKDTDTEPILYVLNKFLSNTNILIESLSKYSPYKEYIIKDDLKDMKFIKYFDKLNKETIQFGKL